MFSSIRRPGRSGGVSPASISRSAWATQATISSTSASASVRGGLRVADPHLDRPEGVVRAHRPPQLGELDDRVRAQQQLDVVAARSAQEPKTSGMPQRGNDFVKVCVRAECRPESRPSMNGEFALIASSIGSTGRSRSHDLDRAVAALDADVDLQRERVVAPARRTAGPSCDAVVVLGVDDVLLAVVATAGACRSRRAPTPCASASANSRRRASRCSCSACCDVLAAAGADLDLGGDQLAGDRVGEHVVAGRRRRAAPRSCGTSSSVAGSTSAHSSSIPTVRSWEVSKTSRAASRSIGLRSGRSRARTGGRRPGSRCGPSPRAAPAAAPRSS